MLSSCRYEPDRCAGATDLDPFMMNKLAPKKRRLSGWIRCLSALPLVCAVIVAFAAAEMIVRRGHGQIASSDHLDPGMSRYDADLGWTLVPGWSGRHQNYDFSAQYRLNRHGFRNDSPPPGTHPERLIAVAGDSFTFGFGVNDDETFVHHLNETASDLGSFVNFAVPGYSTDQEALLLERTILKFKPRAVLLVVYLGNDVFDNALPYPIQVNMGKPYFVLEDGALKLENTPVPPVQKSVVDSREALRAAVLGEPSPQSELLSIVARRSVLLALLRDRVESWQDHMPGFTRRFEPSLALFRALTWRIRGDCERANCTLVLALIGGRSMVEQPGSLSAQYQEYLRSAILKSANSEGIAVIDLSSRLQEEARKGKQGFFFPNDGHLSPLGHATVAATLAQELKPILKDGDL